jgi:hypothetical protein
VTGYSLTLRPGPMQRPLAWVIVMIFLAESGCAGLVPTPTAHQTTLGRLAITCTDRQAEIEFEGFSRSKGGGAARGAGSAFAQCMGELGHGSCSGDLCGAAVILMLGMCGIASVIGGVTGAVTAPTAASVEAAESGMSAVVEARTIQESLRRQVATLALAYDMNLVSVPEESDCAASSTGDYSLLAAAGVDTVLEVALTKAGTTGAGINAPVLLYMQAHARLVQTHDNREVFSADYIYQGRRLTLEEWSANQGLQLLQGLEQGYAVLGSHIYDNVFLLYPFPDQGAHSPGLLATAFGLAPLEPELRGQLTGDQLLGRYFEWKTAGSLRPTFRWQGFPRKTDITAAPEEMKRISNVRYDLVVAREHNMAPDEIVYRRDGLTDARHTIQKTLKPDTRYFWTVRARFELDGRERVTEWGTTRYPMQERLTSPSSWSYRFKTP